MRKFSISFAALTPSVFKNPHSFVSKVKKVDNMDGPDVYKSERIKLEFLMNPDNLISKFSRHFVMFKDIFLDEWIKCFVC
jgi:hypothetical protein